MIDGSGDAVFDAVFEVEVELEGCVGDVGGVPVCGAPASTVVAVGVALTPGDVWAHAASVIDTATTSTRVARRTIVMKVSRRPSLAPSA